MGKKDLGIITFVWLACIGIFIGAYFYVMHPKPAEQYQAVVIAKEIKKKKSAILYGMVLDSFNIIKDKFKRNENLSGILIKYNIPSWALSALSLRTAGDKDISNISAGRDYTIYQSKDSLKVKCMVYESPFTSIIIKFIDSLSILKEYKKIDTVYRAIGGVIESSLYETLDKLKASEQLAPEIAKIFSSQVDFFKIKEGDNFKIIYKEILINGNVASIEKIESAYFEQNGHQYYAIAFSEDGKTDFYDENGNSLNRGNFLMAPLKFFKITSKFSRKRFHPVQKIFKAHLGTDYAAPYGTPIIAVGSGTVIEARYSQFNGNFVKIKHNNIYTTQYLHMSKIARGMRPGAKVQKGGVIGYVGSTGLATGPHVCFRFWKNGKQIDGSKTKVMIAGAPIRKSSLSEFTIVKDKMIEELNKIEYKLKDGVAIAR